MIKYKLVGSQGFYFDLGVHLKTGDCQVNKLHCNTNLVCTGSYVFISLTSAYVSKYLQSFSRGKEGCHSYQLFVICVQSFG